jgi:hypothetical protein
MTKKKPTHWIYEAKKGSPVGKRVYFNSYAEAKRYVDNYMPGPKGIYHIYPVDGSGYQSKSTGRKSFHTS